MASIVQGYEYDIFISYRQKDNKGDRWVSEFVDALKTELESTFKEEISVYFDINPHDGLMESHEVGDSLKEKLKCLIFIPVISRTYCDPKSFAWEHEFKAFVELASHDKSGLKVRLPGGNVASRVLPVRIYDLNMEDVKLCESVLGGVLRGIEFIYKSAGVNRPLRVNEDHAQDNLNKTYYRDQINKFAHSIQDIIQGLRTEQPDFVTQESVLHHKEHPEVKRKVEKIICEKKFLKTPGKRVIYSVIILIILTVLILEYPKIIKRGNVENFNSEEILKKAISVIDPYSIWSNYSGKIHLIYVEGDGNIYSDQTIEIQTKEGYYKCSSRFFEKFEIETSINKGKCFMKADSSIFEEFKVKRLGLTRESIPFFKQHHYCCFGLLMELKGSGLHLNNKVFLTKFHGTDCLTLTFKNDSSRVKNDYFKGSNWTVFIDPENYFLRGFKVTGFLNMDCVISGNLSVGGIITPFCRIFYSNSDNSISGIELYAHSE